MGPQRSDLRPLLQRKLCDRVGPTEHRVSCVLRPITSTFGASWLARSTATHSATTASITITLDRHGHLFPGSEREALGLLNAYLDRQDRGEPNE